MTNAIKTFFARLTGWSRTETMTVDLQPELAIVQVRGDGVNNGYYWVSARRNLSAGPFESQFDAMGDYRVFVASQSRAPVVPPMPPPQPSSYAGVPTVKDNIINIAEYKAAKKLGKRLNT